MNNLKHIKAGLFIALAMCFVASKIWAEVPEVKINKIGFNAKNQLEIFISDKSEFKVFTLENPSRLVIDIANADFEKATYKPAIPAFATSFRSRKGDGSLRLVFDLNQKISVQKTKFEKGKITAELVGIESGAQTTAVTKVKTIVKNDAISDKVQEFEVQTERIVNPDGSAKYIVRKIPKGSNYETNTVSTKTSPVLQKMPIIVIDSGHGGKDPGTIGTFARTKEKNLTLSYAKELGKQLINTKRYKVYLTRDEDNFIPLRKRVQIARKKKADLFISLHANAISDSGVAGFSIYTLSEKSSDKQAELLAQKENRVDIINGMNFSGASQDIMKTLIDLSQRDTMNGSARFANIAIKSIKSSEINILQNTHRFAGFAVLTAPDMISVLIELGYLSCKEEEKLLNSLTYKRKVAESLTKAIDEYFSKNKT
ncbi:MAG: N-acetylmuramoyl-L-alanine amidase [Pseudomonadota bacterium]